MPQDSFVTDGRSKTKWNTSEPKFNQSEMELPRMGTNIGESLCSFCNSHMFSDVTIRIGSNAYDLG